MEFSRPEYWSWGGSLSLLQGIFPSQGLNPGLLHCRRIPRSSLNRVQGYPQDGRRWRMKIEKEIRKEWHGVAKLLQWARPFTLFSEGAFIPWVVHTARWKMQSQLNIPSVLTFIDTRFLPARVLFFVHYLLAQRPVDIFWPLFDKGWSTRTIIFP